MHYFLGTLALLGVGFIGLLIEIHKQDRQKITSLREQLEAEHNWRLESDAHIKVLDEINATLVMNQKPIPWNKGKKYTLPRGVNGKPLRKQTTYVLSDAPVLAAWDKDGNQTVSPQWENIG